MMKFRFSNPLFGCLILNGIPRVIWIKLPCSSNPIFGCFILKGTHLRVMILVNLPYVQHAPLIINIKTLATALLYARPSDSSEQTIYYTDDITES